MNIDKYIEIFTNLEKDIIELICEQNLDPNTTFEKLLEISENINKQSYIDIPISNIIEDPNMNKIDNYLISSTNKFGISEEKDIVITNNSSDNLSEDTFDDIDESSWLLGDNKNILGDSEGKKKCPCISLSSLYHVVVDNKQKVRLDQIDSINDEDEYDKFFQL